MASLTNRWKFATVVVIAVFAILVTMQVTSNPLRYSDAEVRDWLLSITPLGTTRNEVEVKLGARGWSDSGYQQTLPPPAEKPFLGVDIGGYQGLPWYVHVSAFWEFDESNRLKNIRIRRIIDSP